MNSPDDLLSPPGEQSRPGTRATRVPPVFFPIPQRGPDPHFGLARSSYYDLERRGLLRLVRLRKPGNLRGKVLIRYADVADVVNRIAAGEAVK